MSYRNQQAFEHEPVTRRGQAGSRFASEEFSAPNEFDFPATRFETDEEDARNFNSENPHKPRTAATRIAAARTEKSKPATAERAEKDESWIVKRGHLFSYIGIFLFTFVLYFRPYELFPQLSAFSSMAMVMALLTLSIYIPSQFTLEGNLTARPREVNLLLLLTLCALASIPFGIDPAEGWATFNDSYVKAVLMFIVMVNVVRTEWRLKGLIWISLGVGCLLSLNAIDNFRAGNFTVEGYRVEGNLGGMFGNPNDMALHLVTMIPLAVALMLTARNVAVKALYAACAALMMAGTVVTFSRGGFLGLVFSGILMAWKFGRKNRLPVFAVCLLIFAAFIAFAPGGYGQRLLSLFNSNLDAVGSSSARRELLIHSIKVSLRHPLFGVGMGGYHIMSPQNHVSHNAYTQVAAELGMAALAFYTMFIVTPLKRLWQIERETFDMRRTSLFCYLAIGMQASLVAYMVGSFFASVAYQWYVYYLVAYAIALRRIYDIEHGAEKERALAGAEESQASGLPARESGQATETGGIGPKLERAAG
jgi:putative inorganic carbon (HCO3(-)) transporter